LECIEKINKRFIGSAYEDICKSSIRGYCSIQETKQIHYGVKKEYVKKSIDQYKKYFEIYKNDPSWKKSKKILK
jgi:hypothetical protein